MLRVAILDHHPAVRGALRAGIDAQAAITVVGAAADAGELRPLLEARRVDLLVLGHPSRDHGTETCRRVRSRHPECRVVLYTAPTVAVSAVLAGAHAVVDRAEDFETLLEALWTVASGGRMLPAITPALRRNAARQLGRTDQAILAMVLDGTPRRDVAAVAGLSPRELEGRCAAMLATLAGRRVALEPDRALAA